MNLEKQIYIRKSCRNYFDEEIDMNIIHDFMKSVKLLNEGVNYRYDILTIDDISNRARFSAPYYLAIYCDDKENYLDMGFIFQQLCLHLQSIGIGNCWVGLASPKIKDSDFVISIAFGKSDKMTRNRSSFKRKTLSKISDAEDEVISHERGYSSGTRPEDYLDAFSTYIKTNINEIAALNIVEP